MLLTFDALLWLLPFCCFPVLLGEHLQSGFVTLRIQKGNGSSQCFSRDCKRVQLFVLLARGFILDDVPVTSAENIWQVSNCELYFEGLKVKLKVLQTHFFPVLRVSTNTGQWKEAASKVTHALVNVR